MEQNFSEKPWQSGFALVVTISLMVLLTVIAVGLLTLSSISLRTSSQGSAQAEAQANARMALMLAIGQLQTELGPDQRVSANGAILSQSAVNNAHWTGVWESWQAGPPGTTTSPDTPSEHQTIAGAQNSGMSPTYDTNREDHFRSWLVSLDPKDEVKLTSATSLALTGSTLPDQSATGVQLVGAGSLGPSGLPADYVSAGLIPVRAASATVTGRYGWWIGDESQKARIMDDSYLSDPAGTLAEEIFRQQAPASTGTRIAEGLENITNADDSQLGELPSLHTLDLVNGSSTKAAENFHDISTYSYGVLADVREGGLKRDLSTLLERPISTSETSDKFMLYRFDSNGQERVPIQDLAAYYQMYDSSRDPYKTKGIRYTSSPQNDHLSSGIQVAAPDYGDSLSTEKYLREYTSMYRSPVPVKVQLLVGMKAEAIPNAPPGGNTHRLILFLAFCPRLPSGIRTTCRSP